MLPCLAVPQFLQAVVALVPFPCPFSRDLRGFRRPRPRWAPSSKLRATGDGTLRRQADRGLNPRFYWAERRKVGAQTSSPSSLRSSTL